MRQAFLALSLLLLFGVGQPSQAQINIQSDDGNSIQIGPGGISVRKGSDNKTVRVSPGSITIDGGNGARVKTSVHSSAKPTGAKKTVVKKTTTVTKSSSGGTLTLEEQVALIEVAVSGKKTVGAPLLARVEKLEIENLGSAQSGSVKERIVVLAKTIGVDINKKGSSTTSTTTTVTTRPTDQINQRGLLNITSDVAPGGQSVETSIVQTSSGSDIIINQSGETLQFKCENNKVIINSSNCNVKLRGPCSALVINGSNNNFDCESLAATAVNGSHNTLRCGNLSALSVTGSFNDVGWSNANHPVVSNNGSSNKLHRM